MPIKKDKPEVDKAVAKALIVGKLNGVLFDHTCVLNGERESLLSITTMDRVVNSAADKILEIVITENATTPEEESADD